MSAVAPLALRTNYRLKGGRFRPSPFPFAAAHQQSECYTLADGGLAAPLHRFGNINSVDTRLHRVPRDAGPDPYSSHPRFGSNHHARYQAQANPLVQN
jgi:hypothetical protein